MCSKKVFNIQDKVFAKVRGHRAWPAIVTEIIATNTLSQRRYIVHFYGTGEYAECKREEIFPYRENKAKLGKPIKLGKPTKLKLFVEALSQIESDDETSPLLESNAEEVVAPSNTNTVIPESSTTNELEKSDKIKKNKTYKETVKLTIDKSNVSKQTKRKISDFKPVVETSKKLMPYKITKPITSRIKDSKEPSKKPMTSKTHDEDNFKEPIRNSMTKKTKVRKNSIQHSMKPMTKINKIKLQKDCKELNVTNKIKVEEKLKEPDKINVFEDPKLNATPIVLINRLPSNLFKKASNPRKISSVSLKKIFKVKDRVFAKVRGYRAWPAKISEIIADIFSQPRYRVDFYGTGERALCKPEDLFPYKQYISKLGSNSNKNLRFAEALFQMECDTETSVGKKLSLSKKHSDSFKGTKRNVSVIEHENPSMKLMRNKKKIPETSVREKLTKLPSSKNRLGIFKKIKRKISVVKLEKNSMKLLRNKIKVREKSKQPSKKLLKIKIGVPENLKGHSKKAMTNTIDISKDPKLKMQPIVVVKKLSSRLLEKYNSWQKPGTSDTNMCTEEKNSITEKPPSSKTVESISKMKDSPISKNVISSHSKSKAHALQYGKRTKPKEYTDYQYDSKKTEHTRLSKGNSKQCSKKQKVGSLKSFSVDWIDESEGSNTSSIFQKTSRNHAVVPDINEVIPIELKKKSVPPYKDLRGKEKNFKLIEKPSTSNTVKSISKIKDGLTSNKEISSNSSNVAHILQSAHKTMPKKCIDCQYDSKNTEPSRSSKGNSKQNVWTNECVTSSEQNLKAEGSNTSSIFQKTPRNHAAIPDLNEYIPIELKEKSVPSCKNLCVKENNAKIIKNPLGITVISTNDSPTSNNEVSYWKNIAHVFHSTRKTVPKENTDCQYASKKTDHSRLSKFPNSKQNVGISETITSSEQNVITQGSNTSSEFQMTSRNHSEVQDINEAIFKELGKVSKIMASISESPEYLKRSITELLTYLETNWEKNGAYQVYHLALLFIEAQLQHYFYKLCFALKSDGNIHYDKALQSLEQMNELKLNSLMLKKNDDIVRTIRSLTTYGKNEPNTVERTLKADKIRFKADEIFRKLKLLFPVAKGRTFDDEFEEAVSNFKTITKHLTKHDRTKLTIVQQESVPDSSTNRFRTG